MSIELGDSPFEAWILIPVTPEFDGEVINFPNCDGDWRVKQFIGVQSHDAAVKAIYEILTNEITRFKYQAGDIRFAIANNNLDAVLISPVDISFKNEKRVVS